MIYKCLIAAIVAATASVDAAQLRSREIQSEPSEPSEPSESSESSEPSEPSEASEGGRPNIVLIVTDDQGYYDIGYNTPDDAKFHTPNLDDLANQGIKLTRTYVASTCTPTRAALLTGKTVNNLGIQDGPFVPSEEQALGQQFTLLPQLLKEKGYSTIGVGKWHLGRTHNADMPTSRGFDKYFGSMEGAQDYFLHEAGLMCNSQNPVNPDNLPGTYGSNCYAINGYDLNYNGEPKLVDDAGVSYRGQYYTDILATQALKLINEHDEESPLFLYLAPTAPHAPMQVTDEYLSLCSHITPQNGRNVLCGMMAGVDKMIGDVVSALDAKGMKENTIFAFTSDNGGVRLFGSINQGRSDKGSMFEGGVRAAAFLSGNALKDSVRGTSYDGLVHANDIFATLARAGGVHKSVIEATDGLPIMHKEMHQMDPQFHREVVQLGYGSPAFGSTAGVVFEHNSHYYKWTKCPDAIAFYGGFTNVIDRGDFFFDLTTDPDETNNLINDSSYAALVAMGVTYAELSLNQGISSAYPRYLSAPPTAEGCWLPKDSPYLNFDCEMPPVIPFPQPAVPILNQVIFQRAALQFQAAQAVTQPLLQQTLAAVGALLATDSAPCTPQRAAARGATAVALNDLQGKLVTLASLTAGSPQFFQQIVLIQQTLQSFAVTVQAYMSESACGGVGVSPAVAAAQMAVVAAQQQLAPASQASADALTNVLTEGQICGCACGFNCPTVTMQSLSVKKDHTHPDLRISAEDVFAGKVPSLYYD